jgi:DNA polymerase-3 subunit epsilon
MPYRLTPWPYPGKIGVLEQHADTGRIQLCHLETVKDEDENELQDVLTSRLRAEFDLDIYKVLQTPISSNGSASLGPAFSACGAGMPEY